MEQSVKKTSAGFIPHGKARLQSVTQRHQFINLGDNAALLGKRPWDREAKARQKDRPSGHSDV